MYSVKIYDNSQLFYQKMVESPLSVRECAELVRRNSVTAFAAELYKAPREGVTGCYAIIKNVTSTQPLIQSGVFNSLNDATVGVTRDWDISMCFLKG